MNLISNKIKLTESCFNNFPFQAYQKDFSFIVNGEEIKTSRFIADILSPLISQIHSVDPTSNTFTINTSNPGNFSSFLDLIDFKEKDLPDNELPFILEVSQQLKNESIKFTNQLQQEDIDNQNILTLIKKHENNIDFYSNCFISEIEYISSHFYELCEDKRDELKKLQLDTLIQITSNSKIQVKDEDQLLNFVNELYSNDRKYSILYEYILFENLSSNAIIEFLQLFDYNDMTKETWNKISERMKEEIKSKTIIENNNNNNNRYRKNIIENGGFVTGILDKLRNEVIITSSSLYCEDEKYSPANVLCFDDRNKIFHSEEQKNSWICFDFVKRKVIPQSYTFQTIDQRLVYDNERYPKSWVIEGKNDNENWEIIDERENVDEVNGNNIIKTFQIDKKNQKEFRFIRMKITGPSWSTSHYLALDTFEISGEIV